MYTGMAEAVRSRRFVGNGIEDGETGAINQKLAPER